MTAVMPLGTFNQLDLTEAWPQEDQNFTPGLAQPERKRETHGSPN
jgi:hypothetical protein